MKKQLMLIRVLLKCGRNSKSEKNDSAVGDMGELITWIICAAVAVLAFLGGRYAGTHQDVLGNAGSLFGTVLTASGLAAFFLTFMTAINQLYLSSDLDVLITLPFSPMQIVVAKLVSVSTLPAGICMGISIPAAIGFAIASGSEHVMLIPSVIIGSIVMTVYAVSAATILLMVIMRLFRFVRSRNLISVITTLLVFALSMAYIMFSQSKDKLDEERAVSTYLAISGMMTGMSAAFPSVGFTAKAISGDVPSLLISVAIGAAAVALMLLCARQIYFSAALGMTDANGKRGKLDEGAMQKNTRKMSPERTLARREVRHILRTPALITNGYLFSLVVPFVVIIPMVTTAFKSLTENMAAEGVTLTIGMVREMIAMLKLSVPALLLIGAIPALMMASMAVAFSSLSRFIISREGKDFAILKAMPIPMRTLVIVKRRVACCFNGITGFCIPAIAAIALGVLRIVPIWISAVWVLNSFAWLITIVDFCALPDVKKPNLNWESEADVTKNNIRGVVLFLVAFAISIGIVILITVVELDWVMKVAGPVLTIAPVVLAIVLEIMLRKTADQL